MAEVTGIDPLRLTAAPSRSALGVRVLWVVGLFLLGSHFALNLQQNGRAYLDADAYSHFHAKRPYQYRALMAPVMEGLIDVYERPAPARVLERLPTYLSTPEAAAYVTINTVCFAASCLLVWGIARRTLRNLGSVRFAMATYVGMAYLFFVLNPNLAFILPYDLPALVLSQACILCILDRRWAALWPLFAIATVNRESSFLVVVFLAARTLFDREGLRSWSRVAILGAIWIALKLALLWAFADLPSDEGLRIVYNLHALANVRQWPALLPLIASFVLTAWALRSATVQREWALAGVVGFLLIFMVGQVTETRAFGDLMVFFAIAIARQFDRSSLQRPEYDRMPS